MIIFKIHVTDFVFGVVDPESQTPIPRNVKAPRAFPAASQWVRFPHWHIPQFARFSHGFEIDNHFPQFVQAGGRQSLGIALLIKALQSLMDKVSYLHSSSVACSFTLVK